MAFRQQQEAAQLQAQQFPPEPPNWGKIILWVGVGCAAVWASLKFANQSPRGRRAASAEEGTSPVVAHRCVHARIFFRRFRKSAIANAANVGSLGRNFIITPAGRTPTNGWRCACVVMFNVGIVATFVISPFD